MAAFVRGTQLIALYLNVEYVQIPWRPNRPVRPTTNMELASVYRTHDTGPTPMQVGLYIWSPLRRIPWHVVVDDHVDGHDIDTSCNHVCCDKDLSEGIGRHSYLHVIATRFTLNSPFLYRVITSSRSSVVS